MVMLLNIVCSERPQPREIALNRSVRLFFHFIYLNILSLVSQKEVVICSFVCKAVLQRVTAVNGMDLRGHCRESEPPLPRGSPWIKDSGGAPDSANDDLPTRAATLFPEYSD